MTQQASKHGLTKAQQAFLQRFPQLEADDPLVGVTAWVAEVEAKLDRFDQKMDMFGGNVEIWTTAILKQAEATSQQGQLFVQQNSTLQQTAKNNERLASVLTHLSPKIDSLQQDSKSQTLSIAAQMNSFDNLSHKLTTLETKLNPLDPLARSARRIENRLDPRNWSVNIYAVAVAIALLLGLNVLGFLQAQHFKRLHNSTLIRLERIERAIGTQP